MHFSHIRDSPIGQQPKQAGFSAAVFADEGHPVSLLQGERHRRAYRRVTVLYLDLRKGSQPLGVKGERRKFQAGDRFLVFEKGRFVLDGLLLPLLYHLGSLHHLGRFMADVSPVHRAVLIFGLFRLV